MNKEQPEITYNGKPLSDLTKEELDRAKAIINNTYAYDEYIGERREDEKGRQPLKNYVVLKDSEGNYIHWSTEYYQNYVMKAIRKGGTPAYTVVAHFNGDEDLIKELASPSNQSSAIHTGVEQAAESWLKEYEATKIWVEPETEAVDAFIAGAKWQSSGEAGEWNAAITIAINTCVGISDEYNNDDLIEQADAANKCANEIGKFIGQRNEFIKP